MKTIECPICDKEIILDKFLRIYISDFNNQEYKLYHCDNCEIEFWWPLKIIPEFYEKEGDIGYEFFHKGLRDLQSGHNIFFKNLPNVKGKLLDVGCGDGIFLKEVQKYGFDVYGIDFDKKSIEIARNKFGLKNVYPLSLEDFSSYTKKENLKFDIITTFEVLEHQDNPQNFIKIVRELLTENGYFVGTIPNRDGSFIEFYRGKIDKNDLPPHHFLWFSVKSLKNFLESNDFIIEKIITKNVEELMINLEMFITGKRGHSLKVALKRNTSNIKFVKVLKILRKLVFYPLAYFSQFFLKGTHIYFQAKLK